MRPRGPAVIARTRSGWRSACEVAVALHGELGQVHRARGVDREHDLDVDLDGLLRMEARGREGEESRNHSAEHAGPPSLSGLTRKC